jgi:hypothetical protein
MAGISTRFFIALRSVATPSASDTRFVVRSSLVAKTCAHMAVIEDRVVWAVGLLDLIERMGDQETFQVIARHESERRFEEVQGGNSPSISRTRRLRFFAMQILCQASADLI